MSAPHRVLFVEDYPPFKRSFARYLARGYGLAVTVAESGEEAIGQFGAISPELVILDLGLPGVDGTETLQIIRALPGGAQVPVIVLTGSNDPEKRQAANRLDIEGYVLKENATGEFKDVLLSIFPDLRATDSEPVESVGHGINLDDGMVGPRVSCSKRSVRVLLPMDHVDQPPEGKRWARNMVRRAFGALGGSRNQP